MFKYTILPFFFTLIVLLTSTLAAKEYKNTSYYVAYDASDKTQFVLVMPSVHKVYTHKAGHIAPADLSQIDSQFDTFPQYINGELCFSSLTANATANNGAEKMANQCYSVNFFYTQKELVNTRGVAFMLTYTPTDTIYEGLAGDATSFKIVKQGSTIQNKNSLTNDDYTTYSFNINSAIVSFDTKINNNENILVGETFQKQIITQRSKAIFSLLNAPEGMTINSKTGMIYWTPTPNQAGDINIRIKISDEISDLTLTVKNTSIDTSHAIFIAPNGNNDNNGSYEYPIKDTKNLCTNSNNILENTTIYYRGGVYYNPDFGKGSKNNASAPRIRCSGTNEHWLRIQPWGNEKAKIKFDSAVGVRLSGNYIKFQGFEIEGVANEISYEDAVANWWIGDRYYNGSGIVTTGHHVEVNNNIVHATPASGISAQHGDFVTLQNNIVYDCDWWTISGSKGIGVTNARSSDGSTTAQNIKIENNLIFNVESRVISRVWSKGKAHMTIDEGEGILVQINDANYTGRYLIKNNFLLFTGKGIVVNKTDKADLVHNTLFQTGTTISGNFKGLRGNNTDDTNITGNAVSIIPYGYAYNMGGESTNLNYGRNCFEGNETVEIESFKYVNTLFPNASTLDFTTNFECTNLGASQTVWNTLKAKADSYGIEIKPTNWKPDYVDVTRRVISAIPKEANVDWSTWNDREAFNLNITNLPNNIDGRPSNFVLEVAHPYKRIDIANKYGKATQGTGVGYYYYEPASNTIDNNDSTFNHTRGGAKGENWVQIELPSPTKVSKVVLQNRGNNSYRLTNAKVYISDTPYTGTVNESNLVKTLIATNNEQVILFDTAKSGTYLLVKGEELSSDNRHIHLKKIEIYGEMPTAPIFSTTTTSYLIPGTTEQGEVVAAVNAIDFQEDALNYSIVGTVPFSIDEQGIIRVNGALNENSYSFEVEVSDGVNVTRQTMTIDVTSNNVIADILVSGDVLNTKVTEEELIQATIDEIESLRVGDSLLKALYKNEAISYDPTNRSQLINITGDAHKIFPILQGNGGRNLAVAGVKKNSRFAAFGAAPMEQFENGNNLSYEPQFKRLLSWLISNDMNDTLRTSKTIGLSFTNSDKSDIKTWLTANYPNWTIQECDRNNPDFSTCYNNVDLIITGWQTDEVNTEAVRTRLEKEVTIGTPILYLHTWYEAYNSVAHSIAKLFEFKLPYGGNYWSKDKVDWNNIDSMQSSVFENLGYGPINKMLKHFQANDYVFDWSVCRDGDKVGSQYDDCSDVVGLSSEFQKGANAVRSMIIGLDNAKKNIFVTNNYRLQKLLTLIADKFRQSVSYPMDKVTTNDNEFMKSYYADHAVYNYRKINPTQPDMGNFSSSDFSTITPSTRVVNIQSKRSFKATGAYALPGQTVKVTRSDSSDLTVKVFINSLRSGATHQYQKNGYNRPKYLQTPHIEIKSGESIEITSPYGGPIQLEFSKNDLPVNITFENVGEHPFWASSTDNMSFTQKLEAGNYNWAEIATAGFTVHSKLDKMRQSVADTRWGGTAEGLANAVLKYTSNYPHVLAGFKGNGVDIVPEIHDWAEDKGLTIETIDIMKHMNADQASCGYGCSGNPYDAYWAFNPIGHGDIHEMGHSMQKMRFEGFPNHAATNTFSYYTKLRYFENTGEYGDCQGLPFKKLFETIQSSVGESDVTAYLKTNLWDVAGLGEQYLLKIEAMMHAQKLGKVQRGWHVLARVHILEREMKRAKQDWDARKASVGFSTYSLDEINTIRNNDWLTIAYSYASELDLRNYFDMMGIPYSQKAREQIASFGFDVVPNSLFVSTSTGYCKSDEYGTLFDRPTLPIDGLSTFP